MSGLILLTTVSVVAVHADADSLPSAGESSSLSARNDEALQKSVDALIEHRIEARFAASTVKTERFIVSVRKGVAIIGGTTKNADHRIAATNLAKKQGAIMIVNRIRLSTAGPTEDIRDGVEVASATIITDKKPLAERK
jgi:hypothetical protein